MSILFEAWRRARGEADEISRALGAPPAARGARFPALPWVLCIVLAAVAGGLGVYAWLAHGPGPIPASQGGGTTSVEASPAASGVSRQDVAPAVTARQSVRQVAAAGTPGRASAGSAATAPVAVNANARTPSLGTAGESAATGARAGGQGPVPDSVRAALPSFKVTVHVWNPTPSARFVVVNGNIYHEGQTLMPGVRLVKITRGGEVVRFRGRRLDLSGP